MEGGGHSSLLKSALRKAEERACWGPRDRPVCSQQRVWSVCCTPGVGGRGEGGVERSEVMVQAWRRCSPIPGEMDAIQPRNK